MQTRTPGLPTAGVAAIFRRFAADAGATTEEQACFTADLSEEHALLVLVRLGSRFSSPHALAHPLAPRFSPPFGSPLDPHFRSTLNKRVKTGEGPFLRGVSYSKQPRVAQGPLLRRYVSGADRARARAEAQGPSSRLHHPEVQRVRRREPRGAPRRPHPRRQGTLWLLYGCSLLLIYGSSMAYLYGSSMPPPLGSRRATCKTPAAISMTFSRRPRAACPPTAAPCRPAPTSSSGRYLWPPPLAPTFSFLFSTSLSTLRPLCG